MQNNQSSSLEQNKQRDFIFGFYTLKKNTPQILLKKYSQIKKEILYDFGNFVQIRFLRYLDQYDQVELLSWMEQYTSIYSEDLITQRNAQLIFPYQIAHINFNNLQMLTLNDCQFTSIQPFSWHNFPSLKSVQLYRNFITSLKPFSKANFKVLEHINVEQNFYTDSQIQYLAKIKNKDKLQSLNIQNLYVYDNFTIEQQCNQRFCWTNKIYMMFKLQTDKLIRITSYEKLIPQRLLKRFINRFIYKKLEEIQFEPQL